MFSSANVVCPISTHPRFHRSPLILSPPHWFPSLKLQNAHYRKFSDSKLRVVNNQQQDNVAPLVLTENQQEVKKSVNVLKNAAKTRKISSEEILSALTIIKNSKLDPSGFLNTLGGTESPGRTWMLIFTAQNNLKSGSYFPITAVQRFDAAGMRIENGVYLPFLGSLTFEGRFSWKKRILAFVFEYIQIKPGPFGPFKLRLGKSETTEPTTKDPFFIWFYVDEEIAVAQGKSGGTAFWCRCRRI